MQVPALTSVSVVPLTVHTVAVLEVMVTGSPDDAVAVRAGGVVPSTWLPGDVKLMVCAAGTGADDGGGGVAVDGGKSDAGALASPPPQPLSATQAASADKLR